MTIANVYTPALQAFADKQIDWVSDTIVCALLGDTYTPDQDDHAFLSDLTGELVGGSYARVTLTGKTAVKTAGTLTLSAAPVEFAALTADPGPRYAVFAVNTGVAATSPLIFYMDFEAATEIDAQAARVTVPTTGLVVLTVA